MRQDRRLPDSAHTSRPWLIHDLARDFELEDVWALPTPGGPDDFPTLVALLRHSDFEHDAPPAARLLWTLRWKLGRLFGLDSDRTGLGTRVPSLRDRLPADLREVARAQPAEPGSPFTYLYLTGDERAAEIANRTMHGVMHVGWVPDGTGGYRGQLAILVKPNGRLGALYMAAIKPFRYLIVYPALLRTFERKWAQRNEPTPRVTRT